MKFLVTAALALSVIGLAPSSATAQASRVTTVSERPNGTIVRRTAVRRNGVRRGYYANRGRRTVCNVRFRHGQRIRTCRTVRG